MRERIHNSSNFQIENKIGEFNTYIRKYIIPAIPKVHTNLKIKLEDESFNMIRCMYSAIWTKGNIKSKNITEILIGISVIDYLIENIKELKFVSSARIINSISLLTDIKILVQGWKKSVENESK